MTCLCLERSLKGQLSQIMGPSRYVTFTVDIGRAGIQRPREGKVEAGHPGVHLQEVLSFDTLHCGSLGPQEPTGQSVFSISEPRSC